MKEFCYPSTKSANKIKQFFSDLGFVSSFFLFPLLLKLLPFFPPLLITIFILLLLALASGIFFTAAGFSSLMENLRPRFEERHDLELECKTVSGPPTADTLAVESASDAPYLDHAGVLGNSVSDAPGKWQQNPDEEDERWEEELELRSSSINGGNYTKQNHIIKTQSLRHGRVLLDTNYENPHAPQRIISHTLSDLGSTRKEKEWRRTLACKLFQERHNVGGGGEGMDRLWEVYERTEEENRGKQRVVSNVKQGESRISKSRIVDYLEELEEEEGEDANLCCLRALKFSAGKMQFGMPKPVISNFSKAFKGVKSGWLNHHHHRKKKV